MTNKIKVTLEKEPAEEIAKFIGLVREELAVFNGLIKKHQLQNLNPLYEEIAAEAKVHFDLVERCMDGNVVEASEEEWREMLGGGVLQKKAYSIRIKALPDFGKLADMTKEELIERNFPNDDVLNEIKHNLVENAFSIGGAVQLIAGNLKPALKEAGITIEGIGGGKHDSGPARS